MDAPFIELVAKARRAEWRRRYGLTAICAGVASVAVGSLVLAWRGVVDLGLLLSVLPGLFGGVVLVAGMASQQRAGFMRTPRERWSLKVLGEVDTVVLEIAGRSAAVALAEIVRATYYVDDNWDAIAGIEEVLALALSDGSVLRVPACAEGFGALVAALGARVERVHVT